jgi:hypothetical protein
MIQVKTRWLVVVCLITLCACSVIQAQDSNYRHQRYCCYSRQDSSARDGS